MKNWKILLIMLAIFNMASCDMMMLDKMGEKYHISTEDQAYLVTTFGHKIVAKYVDRIFVRDLAPTIVGTYAVDSDVIFIDENDAPKSIIVYLIAHEMTHAWQTRVLYEQYTPSDNYTVDTPILGKLNMEQEAEIVGFHTQLKKTPIFTNGRQIIQSSNDVELYRYMQQYMEF